MLSISGYYDWELGDRTVSDEDFFVHCCGRYRLIQIPEFQTERPKGSDNYQLLYVAEGQAQFVIEGKWMSLKKGSCVLYAPKEPQFYYYKQVDHPDVYWVHFSCPRTHLLKEMGWGEKKVFFVGTHSQYETLFLNMIHELQVKPPYCKEQLKLLLQQLLLLMSRNQMHETKVLGSYSKEVETAISYFNQKIETAFTIKEYTKEKGLNYYRFIDCFHQSVGVSPRQYLIQLRMTKAKALLENTALSVTEVARLSGYENPLYFSRLFKKTWGIAPSETRA